MNECACWTEADDVGLWQPGQRAGWLARQLLGCCSWAPSLPVSGVIAPSISFITSLLRCNDAEQPQWLCRLKMARCRRALGCTQARSPALRPSPHSLRNALFARLRCLRSHASSRLGRPSPVMGRPAKEGAAACVRACLPGRGRALRAAGCGRGRGGATATAVRDACCRGISATRQRGERPLLNDSIVWQQYHSDTSIPYCKHSRVVPLPPSPASRSHARPVSPPPINSGGCARQCVHVLTHTRACLPCPPVD